MEVTVFFLELSDVKLLVINRSQAQLQTDFFAMVTTLLFEVNYTFKRQLRL